jgi:hypothetical protein
MTGPEHYREAERLLEASKDRGSADETARIAEAQVHATLALAAATALSGADDDQAWQRAAGLPPEPRAPRQRPQPVPYDPDIEVRPPKTRGVRRSRDYDPDTDL